MGEIADALRRARTARKGGEAAPDSGGQRTREVIQALERAERERESRPIEAEEQGLEAERLDSEEKPLDPEVADPGLQAPAGFQEARDPAEPTPGASSGRFVAPSSRLVETLHPTRAAIMSDQSGALLEICRKLALNVRAELKRHGGVSLAIVSAINGEGKTTVALDLSLGLATLSGAREVALVDLDLRRPSVASALGLEVEIGIEDVLAGGATLEDARISVGRPQLDIFPATRARRSAHELLVLPTLGQALRELEQRYELVIVDTPPTLMVPDAGLILANVSACAPVARAGQTRVRHVKALMKHLERHLVVGEILNEGRLARYEYASYDYAAPPEALAGAALEEAGQ